MACTFVPVTCFDKLEILLQYKCAVISSPTQLEVLSEGKQMNRNWFIDYTSST